ncbi:Ig-like domain-containing protein [Acinetobacter sp. YH12068_T]|nr:Ig-like domain-containing protein [Acinetobacter sp. YH12068_T]UUS64497.1 Ig-like domain-containing protein [Acinetobacter sp. YH12068_T]
MKDGQQLIIENYFTDNLNENNVVLEEDDKLYLLETNPNEAGLFEINYNPIDEINPLLYSDSTVGLWTWLVPLVTAGGILAWANNDSDSSSGSGDSNQALDAAEKAVKAAEDANKAAKDALTDAQADGLITPEEKTKLEQALADAKAAEDAAQKAVDALKDSTEKDDLQDRLDNLTDIVIPPVTDANGNGIDDTVDAQIADAEAAVKAAEDAYQAAEDALEEANANGLITPTEKAELEEALKAAQDAKDAAQDAVNALPSAPAAVQDAKDGFQDRIDALTDITIPAVNDANENGVDDSTENPVDLATDLVEAAEDAYQAAEDALTDANADGLITPEEKAALEDALKDAQDAKDAAQNAVDALPDSADKDALQDRIDALTDIEIPAVTDTDGNGIDDTVDAQIADAEAAVKAAEDAYQAAEDALEEANANGLITPTEKAELEEALKAAQDAKDAAQDAVNALPSAPAAVQDAKDGFQDRIDALTDITIPAVNDANENGVDDSTENPVDLATDLVEAAEDAYQAAEDALTDANADGLITPEEKAALEDALKNAQDAKDVAQNAVDALPDSTDKDALQDRIDALTDIEIPAVTDTDGNGIDDAVDAQIADAEAAVKAAEDAYQAAEDALEEANANGLITPTEKAELEEALKAAQDAKDAAQDAVDALPSAPAAVQDAKDGFQDRIDALTDITIPAVTDTDGNGIDDAVDAQIADAEAAVKAAEDAYQAAEDALEEANANGLITPTEKAELEEALKAAQDAKDAAQDAVDALPSAPAAVQDAKDGFQDRIDALTDITIPAVNDANENGVDDSTENPVDLATDLVEAAEDAYQAAEDALTDANTDGLITPEEKAALEDALKDAQDAKELAQNAVDALPAGTDKDDLQDRLDNLTDIVIPSVTDSNNNGVDDATEIAAVEDLVAAAEAAYAAADQALADAIADNAVTQAEVDELTQDLADAIAAKDAAQAAVDGIVADFPTEAGAFQDRIDALTDIVIPSVTDSNNNGVDDATEIAAVEDLVAAAEAAYAAADQALADAIADNAVTQAEVDELTQDLADAIAAKDAAQAAVDGIATDFPTEAGGFQDRIDALTDIVIPSVTDSNNNGVDDATEIAAVEDLVAAAEAAYAAADQALADAIADNAVTQAEVDELTQDLADAIAAKDAAQAAVDGIVADFPTEAGGFQDRIDLLTNIEIPTVTLRDAIDDEKDLDLGEEQTTVTSQNHSSIEVINLLESTGGVDSGVAVTLTGSTNTLSISVSQTSLLAVADAYRVDVYDDNGNVVYSAVTNDSELVGDVAGLDILGITGDNTLTANVTGLPAGTYHVVVSNDASALTNLLDTDGGGVSLQELGDAGVLLGADNQQVILDAVSNALGGGAIATLVTDIILPPVLALVNGLPVDELVGALNESLLSNANAISILGFSVTGLLDTIVDAAATALLSNTLTLLQKTDIKTEVTSITFENDTVSDNVLDNDNNGSSATVTHIQFGTETAETVTAAGVTINGAYGVLTIYADGSYEYVGNGKLESIGKSEVFTYTMLGADGVTTDTATLTINILDHYAPDTPVIHPVNGTNDITGTAEAGSTVVVTDENGNEIGRTTVAADGSWLITNPGLADGTVISAIATDNANNSSQPASVIVDALAPSITLDTATTGDSTPALEGTIDDPTATVVVTVNGIDYEAVNNGDGTWTLADGKLPELVDGSYNVTVKATDTAGNENTITQGLVVEAVLFANDDLNKVNVLDTVTEDNLNGVNGYTFGLLSADVLSGVVDVNIGTNGFKFTVNGDTTQDISIGVSGTTGIDVSIGSVTYANLLLINIDTGEIVATAQNALKLEPWLLTTRLVADNVEFTNIPEGNYTIGFSSTSIDGFLNSLLEGFVDLNLLSGTKISINDSTQYSTKEATGNVLENGSSTDIADIGDGMKVTAVISAETTYALNTPIATDNTETAIAGNYGILYMKADGSYRYVSNGDTNDVGKVDTFTYTVSDSAGNTSQAYLNIRTDAEGATVVWDEDDHQADGVITVEALDDDITVSIVQTNKVSELLSKVQDTNNAIEAKAVSTSTPSFGTVTVTTTFTNTYQLSEEFTVTSDTVANGNLNINAKLLNTVLNTSVSEDWGIVTATYTISGQNGVEITGTLTLTDNTLGADGYYMASIPVNNLIAGDYTISVEVKNVTTQSTPAVGNTQTLINAAAALHSNNGEFAVDTSIQVTETSLNTFTTVDGIYSEGGNLLENDTVSDLATFSIQQGAVTYRFENGHIYQNDVLLQNQDSVDINGLYGTLNVKANGDYTYTAMNSEIGKTESFAYTVSDTGGFTDTTNLNIGIGASITGSAYDDSYSTYAGIPDTVIFNLLSDDNSGGNGHDTWSNFSVTEGDRIDVNALLQDGLSTSATDINYVGNYIKVNTSGNDTVIRIDRDGSSTDSTYTETELLTLKNVNTTLQELLDNNQLLF